MEKNNMEQENSEQLAETETSRRDFLRKSAFAAFATPAITTLLINKAAAAASVIDSSDDVLSDELDCDGDNDGSVCDENGVEIES